MNEKELLELCKTDREEKLAVIETQKKQIEEKREEFGLKYTKDIASSMKEQTDGIRKGIFLTHKDFDVAVQAINGDKPWALVSGINPSGPLHLGHLALFKENLALYRLGADFYVPISNDESFIFDKAPSQERAEEIAYETVIPSIIAMGFEPDRTHIFVDSAYPSIYTFAMQIAKHFSLTHVKGVFGFDDSQTPAYSFYMGGMQIAHILLPQLPEFGGPRPTVVPVGMDQHPYLQLSRRYARRFGMVPPAELNLRFLPSLLGPEDKMAASNSNTCIYVTDTPDVVEKKIKTAYTGGSPLLKFQQEFGGIPEVCSVYGILQYHLMDAPEAASLAQVCKSGEQKCRECKAMALSGVVKFLAEHQAAMEKARKNMKSFMLKQPVRSYRADLSKFGLE